MGEEKRTSLQIKNKKLREEMSIGVCTTRSDSSRKALRSSVRGGYEKTGRQSSLNTGRQNGAKTGCRVKKGGGEPIVKQRVLET